MDKRKYIAQLHILETLPVPETILHSVDGKDYKLLGYIIGVNRYDELEIEARIEWPTNRACEFEWSLEEVKQCTWEKME